MAVCLTSGDLSLTLLPEIGGSVGAFRLAGFDLMRPMPKGATEALSSGMFPMAPFANCLRDNVFLFAGKRYEVSPNMAGTELNFHGSAWQSVWRTLSQSAASAELALESGWVDAVYQYAARQHFRLDDSGFDIAMWVANRGATALPFSFGLHPWFPLHGNARLRFHSNSRWLGDASGRAVACEPLPTEADYSDWRNAPTGWQNYCHAGWDGRAEINWPDSGIGLSIAADPIFAHLMLHSPASGESVFCLEPQTCAPCGFDGLEAGLVQKGVHILAPGASVGGSVRFQVKRSLM